jgi:hypothetical protein
MVKKLSGRRLKFDGTFTKADFAPSDCLRLWEYGPGAVFRIASHAALNRTEPGIYAVTANTPFAFALKGAKLQTSADNGKTWKSLEGKSQDGWVEASLKESLLAKPLLVRVSR